MSVACRSQDRQPRESFDARADDDFGFGAPQQSRPRQRQRSSAGQGRPQRGRTPARGERDRAEDARMKGGQTTPRRRQGLNIPQGSTSARNRQVILIPCLYFNYIPARAFSQSLNVSALLVQAKACCHQEPFLLFRMQHQESISWSDSVCREAQLLRNAPKEIQELAAVSPPAFGTCCSESTRSPF